VRELVKEMIALWGSGAWQDAGAGDAPHEAGVLRLSWEKAAQRLDWRPAYAWRDALRETVTWFKAYTPDADMSEMSLAQIERYAQRAAELGIAWVA